MFFSSSFILPPFLEDFVDFVTGYKVIFFSSILKLREGEKERNERENIKFLFYFFIKTKIQGKKTIITEEKSKE